MPARLDGLSFFFPALNEEDNVAPIVEEAVAVLPRFADDIEITVVDDGSTDRTGAIADELATKDPHVRVIHHGTRRGYGGAVRSGLSSATKPWIFYTDGDRQFALEDLERLIAASDGEIKCPSALGASAHLSLPSYRQAARTDHEPASRARVYEMTLARRSASPL